MSNARDKANIPSLNFSSTGIDDNATSTAITIDSSQKVGIGTTAPQSPLHVIGTNETASLSLTGGASNSSVTQINAVNATATVWNILEIRGQQINFDTVSLERMRIDSFGNVGIGTTAPDAKLSVNGVASFGDGTALLPSIANFGDLNTGMWFPAADTIAFSEGGAEAMRITSSGNVGIGTSSPSARLDVTGINDSLIKSKSTTSTGIGGFEAHNNTGTSYLKVFQLGSAYGGTTFGGVTGNDQAVIEAQAVSSLAFTTQGGTPDIIFAPQRSQKVIIKSNGNVGINTSSPSSTLDVNGTIRGNLELAPGKEYSMTSGSGTGTAIFDTNISLTTFGILEVFYRGNSNVGGTASYNQTGLYYVQVGTGFNGSAVAVQINQTEVFKHVPFGSPPALTFSSVIFNGSSESSSSTSTAGCQIRIKIAGYNTSHTGGGTQVMIRRIF